MPLPRTRLRWLTVLLATVLAALALAPAALAQDNEATAVNQEDGATQIDIAFDVRKVMNGIVDQTNAAKAYASCQECQTIAIAIQIVLVSGDVDVVAPQNIAVALNDQCPACLTVAFAYQFVWGNGEKLRLTGEAQRRIAELARAFRALEDSGGDANAVLAETNRLLHELSDVLSTGVESVGPKEDSAGTEDTERAAGEPEAEATPEGTETPTPDGEADPAAPEATPTPAPEAPAPEETATPEPATGEEPAPSATP